MWYLIVSIPDLCTLTYFVAVGLLYIATTIECGDLCAGSLFCNVFCNVFSSVLISYSIFLLRTIYIQLVASLYCALIFRGCLCSVSHPNGAVDQPMVYDCSIVLPYSLPFGLIK